jgi:hypothetical protein
MSEAERFTSEEWRTLQFAPFWAFMAGTEVENNVGNNSDFDVKTANTKLDAFEKEVSEATLHKGRLVREVLTSIGLNRKGWFTAYLADSRSILEGLSQVQAILDAKADSTEALLFKGELISFVDKGARVSGPISRDEETGALFVALLLRFNPKEYARTGAADRLTRPEMRQLLSAVGRRFR